VALLHFPHSSRAFCSFLLSFHTTQQPFFCVRSFCVSCRPSRSTPHLISVYSPTSFPIAASLQNLVLFPLLFPACSNSYITFASTIIRQPFYSNPDLPHATIPSPPSSGVEFLHAAPTPRSRCILSSIIAPDPRCPLPKRFFPFPLLLVTQFFPAG